MTVYWMDTHIDSLCSALIAFWALVPGGSIDCTQSKSVLSTANCMSEYDCCPLIMNRNLINLAVECCQCFEGPLNV